MEKIVETPKLCPEDFEIIYEGASSKYLCIGRIEFSIKFGCVITQPFLTEGIIKAVTWREVPVPNQLLAVFFLCVSRRGPYALLMRAVGISNTQLGIQSGLYSIGIRCQFDKFTKSNQGSVVLAFEHPPSINKAMISDESAAQYLAMNGRKLFSCLYSPLSINPSHSLSFHVSNAFGAAVGTSTDAGCYATTCGDVNVEVESSSLRNHATIQQFISVGAGFLWRALTALFTREGHSSQLSVSLLPAAAIFNNYLVIIYTGATIIFNNMCFRGRALIASFLRAVFEMFSISMFCGLSQSHFRLRGSERISGLAHI